MLVLLVLAALLAAADRYLVHLAERTVAEQAQASADLRTRPTVTIHGFPFLTQAVRGRYARIDVSAGGLFPSHTSGIVTWAFAPMPATRRVRVSIAEELS